MCAKRQPARRGRPRRPSPKTLPNDLYDYDDDPAPTGSGRRRDTPLLGSNGEAMRATDDWPDYLPVTETEVDIFERYFGDVLGHLFKTTASDQQNQGLHELTSDVNDKP